MTATEMVRTVARRELALARASLDLLDHQLGRLGGRADLPRHALRRVREALERPAGASAQGSAPPQDAGDRGPADPAGTQPTGRSADTGSAVLTSAEQDTAQMLAEEYLEEEDQHVVGELADDEELRRVQAELRAKHTLQEQDEQKAHDS